ncbi:MAG TPA: Ig-like domain-containing protein [Kofleriaceae bacterium]|nr:Ig-like domain-containing protein [Kofleriaceae bacterium]
MLRRSTSHAQAPLVCALLAACSTPTHDRPLDAGAGDALDAAIGDGRDADATTADAPPDAAPDASVPDTTPPHLLSVTPANGTPTWLGAPVRFVYDEPLDAQSVAALTASAQLDGSVVGASVSFEAPSTIRVTLDTSARGVGSLSLHLGGSVEDAAGNAATVDEDEAFVVAPWSNVPIDRGIARSSPKLAVGTDGSVYAAWTVGPLAARKLAVSVLDGTTWRDLGMFGASNVTSSAIALDENGDVVVAYIDLGSVFVSRFSGGAWASLPSPGDARYVALAKPPSGAPMLALFGSTASVSTLVGNAWQPLGMDVAMPAPLASEPVLAASAADRAAIGWIDDSGALRVYRFDGAWTAMSTLTVGTNAHLSLAARGSSIAIAWDQYAGSYGVLAAMATGSATTWTRLGRALDIDMEGDAVTPAVALDSSGAPIVAWTELVEENQRGVIARWSGSSWAVVGGITWLASTTGVPLRTELALARGDVPVVATAASGTAVIARFNGPRTPSLGLATRASIDGCGFSVAAPPTYLSQTGCFSLATANHPVPHAGLVPYDIVSPLWSDGALKRRWIGLPDNASMTLASNGSWSAPVGSIIVKEFDIETTPGHPATRRPVETRFLINDATSGWRGFSYRWNTAGTDATLQPADTAQTVNWTLDDGTAHPHVYPSRQHCNSCHYPAMGPMLGLRPEQLQRWNDYDGVIAPQLPTLAALGIGPNSSTQPLVSPHEPSETAEHRMRGYMAGNCQHCHNPQYISIKDLRYTTPLAQTKLCEVIVPGDPASSVVYQKVTSRPGMPALGTVVVDPLAQQLLGSWISGMTSCP